MQQNASPFTTATAHIPCKGASEDRSLIMPCGPLLLLVVADGAGGLGGGSRAAELAIEHIRTATLAGTRDLRRAETWSAVLEEADRAIWEDSEAGETTAAVVSVWPDGIAGASVGDSGVWLILGQKYEDLSARQQRKPRLGTGKVLSTPFSYQSAAGTILVATDGLLRYASPASICPAARHPDLKTAARLLTDLVRLPSGGLQDDLALLLCRPAPPPVLLSSSSRP